MIKSIRKKFGMKILELRYPEELIEFRGYDVILIRSFKNLHCPRSWIKTQHITMTIDLQKSLEELFNSMSKTYKKHIRRDERERIEILIGGKRELKEFYKKLFVKLYKEKGLKPWPYDYLRQGTLWIAKKEKEILSGSVIFSDENFASQVFTASKHIRYNGNRLLVWKAIQYYKNKGLKEFNFGGGFSDYKKGFGSHEKIVWKYTKYASWKAKLLNSLRNIIILNFRKK